MTSQCLSIKCTIWGLSDLPETKNEPLKQRKSDDNDNGGDKGGNKRATSEDGHLPVHFSCKRWNRVIIKVNIADYKYIRGT